MKCIKELKGVACVLFLLLAGGLFAGNETVNQIKVQPDKMPDCSSLKSMVESITKDCKTNDEKAIATYDFLRQMNYHHSYPQERGGVGALKHINVYGWALCGGQHTVLAALWKTLGWKWRYLSWRAHTTVEAYYDGDWHYLDTFLKFYTWVDKNGKRTIASQEDINQNPQLVTGQLVFDKARRVCYEKKNPILKDGKVNLNAPAFLLCGDGMKGVVGGIKNKKISGSPEGWAGLKFDDPSYSTDVNLGPGYLMENFWGRVPNGYYWPGHASGPFHSCVDKDYRNDPKLGPLFEPYRTDANGALCHGKQRTWANGTLIFKPDFKNSEFLKGIKAVDNAKLANGVLVAVDASKPGAIVVPLSSPYVAIQGKGEGEGIKTFSISTDNGKSYKVADIANFSTAVNGKYKILAKVEFQKLKSLKLQILFQNNRSALPYLSPGKNKIKVSVANPKALGKNKLVITYAYHTGVRNSDLKKLIPKGYEVGKGHRANWSKKITYVRKSFTGSQLPATFEIDITTPKGKFPVYPRMVYIRREIVSPGSTPFKEAPDLTSTAAVGAKPKVSVSVSGCKKLVIKGPADVKDTIIDFNSPDKNFATVSKDNRLKKQGIKGNAFLVHFDKLNIPSGGKVVKATLSFYVWDPNDKTPSDVRVYKMTKQWVANKATWKNSGNGNWTKGAFAIGADTDAKAAGKVVVATDQGSDMAKPPIKYTFDVTDIVKQWKMKKSPNYGVAISSVRNREIDSGGSGRFQMYSSERSGGAFSPTLTVFYK